MKAMKFPSGVMTKVVQSGCIFFTHLKLARIPVRNDTILIIKIDQVFKKKICSTNLYKNETLRAFSG